MFSRMDQVKLVKDNQNFKKPSPTNFTWSILEHNDPKQKLEIRSSGAHFELSRTRIEFYKIVNICACLRLHAQKNTVGRFFIIFLIFFFIIIFSLSRAYGTLKQYLVRFIYTQAITENSFFTIEIIYEDLKINETRSLRTIEITHFLRLTFGGAFTAQSNIAKIVTD